MSNIAGGILCAGFGTRLRPLTEAIPKPLLPFLNAPIVTYAMERLRSLDVKRFGVNLHHLADAIPPVVDKLGMQLGMEPVYSREWEILGSGGGLRGLWHALGEKDQTLVVLNGDSVMDVNLGPHVIRHEQSGRAITLLVRPRDEGQPGRVWLDPDGTLQGIRDYRRPGAPPDDQLVEHDFTGVHIVQGAALEPVPLEKCDIIDTLYGPMLESDDAIGVEVCDGFWAALDNPELYLETTRRVLEDPSLFSLAPLPQANTDGLWFFDESGIDDKAEFAAPVFCGAHVEIEPGAKIGPNVVLDGVEVKSGARIENAVLYGMGAVEGEWRDCIAVAGKVATIGG